MKSLVFSVVILLSVAVSAGFTHIAPKAGRADIIFVVDDSGSMLGHQENLAKNITKILAEFKEGDINIGVLTTSAGYPEGGIFKGGDSKGSFEEIIGNLSNDLMVGISGDALEKPFTSLLTALRPPLSQNENKGFLRANTPLYIIFVTDADDQSGLSASQVANELLFLKRDFNIHMYGYIIPKGSSCDRYGEPEPKKLTELIGIFKGTVYDLCSKDPQDFILSK